MDTKPNIRYLESGPMQPLANVSAAGRPMQQAGQVVAGALDFAGELALKMKRQQEAGEVATYFARMDEEAAAFSNELMTRQDPENWLNDYKEKSKEWQGGINEQKWLPGTKARVLEDFTRWNSRQNTQLARQMSVRVLEEGRARLSNSLDYYAGRGDMESYQREVQRGAEAGFYNGAEAEKLAMEGDRRASMYAFKAELESNPVGALEQVEADNFMALNPSVTIEDRERLLRAARGEVTSLQRQETQTIAKQIEMGKIGSEMELNRALESSNLDSVMAEEMVYHFQSSQPLDGETRFQLTDSLNDLYDEFTAGKMTKEEYRESHDEIAQVIYAYGTRDGTGGLRQRVHALDPAKWSDGKQLQEKPAEQHSRSVSRLASVYEKQGAFGEVDETKAPGDRAAQAAEILNKRDRLEGKMGEWLKGNPTATGEQVNDAFQNFYLDEIGADIVTDPLNATTEELETYIQSTPQTSAGPKGAHNNISTEVGGSILEMVKQFEAGGEPQGFHPKAYWDHGQWSIGYGTKARQGEVITKGEAEVRLKKEMAMHRRRVDEKTAEIGMTLEAHEADALTSFDYNTGRLEQLLANGKRDKAEIASKMILYRNASGKPLKGLYHRRLAESKLFRHGYSTN